MKYKCELKLVFGRLIERYAEILTVVTGGWNLLEMSSDMKIREVY
jgi:hypothetical protein